MLAHVPFWIVLVLAAGWAWSHPRYSALTQFSLNIRPFWDNLFSELHVTAYAVRLYFSPWNQNFDHDLPEFHALSQWPLSLDLLMLTASGGRRVRFMAALSTRCVRPQLVLRSTSADDLIPRNDLLSERNLYLPSIGLVLTLVAIGSCMGQWLMTAVQRPSLVRFASISIAACLGLVLCLFTIQRNDLYRDRLFLWSDAVRKSPNKARPHNNLGYAYALHGDWDRAIDEFRTAARLDPDFILAQKNLRDAYLHHVGRP